MSDKSMTALVSCFARCYHYNNNKVRIFSDSIAPKILRDNEYSAISKNMTEGIKFFNPVFTGSNEDALRWIVDNQLSPSVLGRQAFCEDELSNAIKIGCKEYLIFAAGYDTYAYRSNENIKVFEIDQAEMIEDKISRLTRSNIDYSKTTYIKCDFTKENWINNIINSNYDMKQKSFCSLLGISYYLTKEDFTNMIKKISKIICKNSYIVFDYPNYTRSIKSQLNETLAAGANEQMKSKYTYEEIVNILSENDFTILKHLDDEEMTDVYFSKYNQKNPNNKILAPNGVSYCLAIKR